MSRKYFRKFRRLKKTGGNSNVVVGFKSKIKKARTRGIIVLIFIIAVFSGIFLYNRYSSYSNYQVIDSIKVRTGANSKYASFGDFVVKYSCDGISYIDGDGTVWDDAYEMKAPMIDICGSYLAIADKDTNNIYIYNESGKIGEVTTSYPIIKLEVAKQGVVAALLEDKSANYIEVYDKEGKQLVSHKTLIDENGYPLNFSISDDGTKMMVSYMTVQSGFLSNKVMFYNFSEVGKNSIDRMVGEFKQYKETIVPTVNFVSNSDAIAIGEDMFSVYKMKDKPDLKKEIALKDEIQKVFYSEDYVGMVFKNDNSKAPYRVEVYKLSGTRVMKSNVYLDYTTYAFSGKNVLMYNDLNCQIISFGGVKKFKHTFKEEISGIIPIDGTQKYLFMTSSAIEKVRLK